MQHSDHEQMEGGAFRLMKMTEAFGVARAVQIAAELGLADLLRHGPLSADELAAATSTQPRALYRLMRALASEGLFTETERGWFALTPLGEYLCEDHPRSLRSWAVFQGLVFRVYTEAMNSLRTESPAFPDVYGEPFFSYLEHHPDQGALFQSAMAGNSRLMGAALVQAYDFTQVTRAIDVAGGDGTLMQTILDFSPTTSGVIFDLPHVADATRERIAAAGLDGRCTVIGGDFFEQVPVGGDVYLLKGILHNWPDAQALEILRACRKAMAPESRLLIVEGVVPPGDAPHPIKFVDLAMLLVYDGRERTREEHEDLLTQADLRLARVVSTASPLSVLEAVPA